VLNNVTANGNGTTPTPTTQLTLTFSGAVTGLTAGNVTISGITVSGTPTVSGSGTSWTVGISIASATPATGTLITVSTPYGSRSVTVFNYTAPSVAPVLNDVTANGDSSTPSTQLTLTFSGAVTGLTAGNVTISGITISGTPRLNGSGTSWTVAITITSATPATGTLITVTTPYGSRSVMVFNYTVPTDISVTISQSSLELRRVNDRETLTATVLPETAVQAVTWASSNPAVATVSSGLVTAIASGMAMITATSVADPSKIGTCVVEVLSTAGN
jgi:hypothetical protein